MSSSVSAISDLIGRDYKEGFVTDVETDTFPPGLDEDVIRALSIKKNEPEFMLDWRLSAFQRWQEMAEPSWAHVSYQPIDFQAISYYSAPRSVGDGPQSQMRSIRNYWRRTTSWVFPCKNRNFSQVSLWTRFLTASQLRQHSRASSLKLG